MKGFADRIRSTMCLGAKKHVTYSGSTSRLGTVRNITKQAAIRNLRKVNNKKQASYVPGTTITTKHSTKNNVQIQNPNPLALFAEGVKVGVVGIVVVVIVVVVVVVVVAVVVVLIWFDMTLLFGFCLVIMLKNEFGIMFLCFWILAGCTMVAVGREHSASQARQRSTRAPDRAKTT